MTNAMPIIQVFGTLSFSISSIIRCIKQMWQRKSVDTLMYPGGVPLLVQRAWYRHHLARLRAAPRLPAGRPLHPPGAIFRYLYLHYLHNLSTLSKPYIYVIYAIYLGAGTLQEAPAGLRHGRREGDCGQVRQHRQRRLPVLRQFIETK